MTTLPRGACSANRSDLFIDSTALMARCESGPTYAELPCERVPAVGDESRRAVSRGGGRESRERVLEGGIASLCDADLVAMLLGAGVVGRPAVKAASGLLERCGGLEHLARLGPAALMDQPGLGPLKAVRLVVSLELGRRTRERSARSREPMSRADKVADWFMRRVGPLDHEEMWVLSLDGLNGLRGARRVSQGGLHGCSVTALDILRAALGDAASRMVLIHNHPSGDPFPSVEDMAMTKKVVGAAAVVGMSLADHVIVTSTGDYVSLLDLGMVKAA